MKMPSADPATVTTFESLVPKGENVTVRKVFGQPAAFVNGNMFFGVFGDRVFVRLGEKAVEEARRSVRVEPFEPMEGRPMTGYAVLPKPLLRDRAKASAWVGRAQKFAQALPPKRPTR